jgi:RNA polymerase sigma-70 factor, ECF subfamily
MDRGAASAKPVRDGGAASPRCRLCARTLADTQRRRRCRRRAESLCSGLRYFDSYREGDAKSWLLKIVRRACYDWIERNRPAEVVPLETDADPEGEVNSAPAALDANALLESRSDLRHLDRLIEALPPSLCEAIVLRELHELDYRQIAEVTGVPIGTVMSRLHRARATLRRGWCGKG